MTKLFTVIAMLVSAASAANASYVCAVAAENPNQPGVYDQKLKLLNGEIAANQAVVLYTSEGTWVTAMVGNDGTLQLASFQKGTKKIDALASGKTDFLSLIDGKNELSIACKKN